MANSPRSGVRVVLDLQSVGAAAVIYAAELVTAAETWRGRGTIALAGGEIAWTWDREPPAGLVDLARRFLRGEWRSRRGAEHEPWPARISRWRDGA